MNTIPNTHQTKEKKVSSYKIKLVKSLHLSLEDRSEESKGEYPGGRFKRYIDVLKSFFQPLMTANLFTLLFLLPVIAIFVFFEVYGYENFGYLINNISKDNIPFFLNQFGVGVSTGIRTAEGSAMMFTSYRFLVAGVALFLPLSGVGIAGNIRVCQKFVWGESLLMKKDKYGNDIPRIVKEFFKGVKKHSGEMVITMGILGVICAASALMTIEFSNALILSNANAGHYIGLILMALIALFSLLIANTYIPFIVSYSSQKIKNRLKNSLIITLGFPIQSIFIVIFAFAPFMLLLLGDMVKIIATIALLSFGVSHWSLVLVNFADYNSELLIQPLYLQEIREQQRAERKSAKKKTKVKQSYKKKGK